MGEKREFIRKVLLRYRLNKKKQKKRFLLASLGCIALHPQLTLVRSECDVMGVPEHVLLHASPETCPASSWYSLMLPKYRVWLSACKVGNL